MALVTTVGDSSADSYVTLTEADVYIPTRFESWYDLTTAEKEDRLRLAALIIDSLPLRGIRATKQQALAFPRILPRSPLWPTDMAGRKTDLVDFRVETYEELVELAEALGVDPPDIPAAVKKAQMEAAVLYASKVLSTEQVGTASKEAVYVMSGDIAVSVKEASPTGLFKAFASSALGPDSLIYFLMRPYITRMRGFAV